jgi:PAS domain S-box-containing protein
MNLEEKTKEELNNELQALQNEYIALKALYEKDLSERAIIKKAQQESENLFRLLAENSTDMIARHDEMGIFTYVSPACNTLLGYDPNDLIGHSAFEFIHPDDILKIEASRKSIVEQPIVSTSTFRILCKSGQYIWFETISRAIIDNETGKVKEIHASSRDVTKRVADEEKIKKSEFFYRTVVSNMPVVTFVTDEHGIFTLSEGMGLAKLGLKPGQVVGLSLFDVYKDHPSIIQSLKNALDGYPQRQEIEVQNFVYDVTYTPIKNELGKVISIIGVSNDITERKRAEERLAESEQKLSAFFSSMTEMVVLHELVFDHNNEVTNYRIIDCNSAYTEITGIKKENAAGRLATEVYQTETAPYLDEFSKVALTGIPYEYTTYYAPMDKHFMISVVSPAKDKFATITTDITEIQQIKESISEKNKELENYLYVASHDLRTPLVNIHGFSQRLQKHISTIKDFIVESNIDESNKASIIKVIDDEIPRTLNFVFSNVSKMDTLINGLLQISRTGRIKMSIKKVDMAQMFKTIVANLNFQITEINAKIEIDDVPACYGDNSQLNQLFTNIITNAIKYRHPNRPLNIKITSRSRYNKITYIISDNGIGIATRHQKRVWDVFYRVDSSSAQAGEGLGLSIAKRITDKHKGKIWVESEEGNGSTFFVELLKNEFTE